MGGQLNDDPFAFQRGFRAAVAGLPADENPYPPEKDIVACNAWTEGWVKGFKNRKPNALCEFAEKIARLVVPGDDDQFMRERVADAAKEIGIPVGEADGSDVISSAGDDFLCGEVSALWALVREARQLLKP